MGSWVRAVLVTFGVATALGLGGCSENGNREQEIAAEFPFEERDEAEEVEAPDLWKPGADRLIVAEAETEAVDEDADADDLEDLPEPEEKDVAEDPAGEKEDKAEDDELDAF